MAIKLVTAANGSTAVIPSGTAVPASLELNAWFELVDGFNNTVAIYRGTNDPAAPKMIVNALPDSDSGTGAEIEGADPSQYPENAYYTVTDNATAAYPAGLYQLQNGAWVKVASAGTGGGNAGAQIQTHDFVIPGVATVGKRSLEWVAPTNGRVLTLTPSSQVAITGQAFEAELLRNESAFTTPAPVRIPQNQKTGTSIVPSPALFNAGEILVARAAQIGTAPSAFATYVGGGSVAGHSGTTTYTVARDTQAVTGAAQISFISMNSDVAVLAAPATGGWTLINSGGTRYSTGGRLWAFIRIDDGTAGPWAFPITGAASYSNALHFNAVYTNVNTSTPVDTTPYAAANATFDSNATPGSFTTSQSVTEVYAQLTNSAVGFSVAPSGYTIRRGFVVTPTSRSHVSDIQRPTAGTFTGPTSTLSTNDTSAMIRFGLVGAGTGGGTVTGQDVTVTMRYEEL